MPRKDKEQIEELESKSPDGSPIHLIALMDFGIWQDGVVIQKKRGEIFFDVPENAKHLIANGQAAIAGPEHKNRSEG